MHVFIKGILYLILFWSEFNQVLLFVKPHGNVLGDAVGDCFSHLRGISTIWRAY